MTIRTESPRGATERSQLSNTEGNIQTTIFLPKKKKRGGGGIELIYRKHCHKVVSNV